MAFIESVLRGELVLYIFNFNSIEPVLPRDSLCTTLDCQRLAVRLDSQRPSFRPPRAGRGTLVVPSRVPSPAAPSPSIGDRVQTQPRGRPETASTTLWTLDDDAGPPMPCSLSLVYSRLGSPRARADDNEAGSTTSLLGTMSDLPQSPSRRS